MYRFLFFLLVPTVLSAQKVIKPDIQYVTVTDTVLINEIKKYIKEEEKIDTLFAKGKGYIMVSFSYDPKKGKILSNSNYATIDTVFTYYLTTSFMSAEKTESTFIMDLYPCFYSIVGGRLIYFGENNYYTYFGFSERSKRRYRNILEKYIEPAGSRSRTWLVINRQTCIYFLRSLGSRREYDSHVTVRKN